MAVEVITEAMIRVYYVYRDVWSAVLERVCAKAVHGDWEENPLKQSSDKEPYC